MRQMRADATLELQHEQRSELEKMARSRRTAAEDKVARGGSLHSRLYIPEVFLIEQRGAINARSISLWSRAVVVTGKQHSCC